MSKSPVINVNSFKFIVIIPAAGQSERFTGTINNNSNNGILNGPSTSTASSSSSSPNYINKLANKKNQTSKLKQYSIICNKPLIYHTVCSFLRLRWIDHIVIIASKDTLKTMEEILNSLAKQQKKRYTIICGDTSRHRSIKNGLNFIELKNFQPDFVIIHDGARPYVDEDSLKNLVTECYQYGVSGCYCPLTSTIISIKKDNKMLLDKVLDRNGRYVSSETPQAFRYNLLIDAYRKCNDNDLDFNTECLDLIKRYTKFDAKLIPVDPGLYFKVTYKKDLYAADNILKDQRNILLHCHFDCTNVITNYKFIKQLKDDLVSKFADVKYFSDSVKLKNIVQHSPGTVHILIHYCEQWKIIMEQNLASSYENLIYIVINNDLNEIELSDGSTYHLLKWSKSIVSKEIKNFYLIFAHTNNLDQESLRIRNIVVYLSKELPVEFSGQTFFI